MECSNNAPTRKDARSCRTNFTELQIVAQQEIRWKGQGQIKKDNITFTIAVKKAKQDSWEQDS